MSSVMTVTEFVVVPFIVNTVEHSTNDSVDVVLVAVSRS